MSELNDRVYTGLEILAGMGLMKAAGIGAGVGVGIGGVYGSRKGYQKHKLNYEGGYRELGNYKRKFDSLSEEDKGRFKKLKAALMRRKIGSTIYGGTKGALKGGVRGGIYGGAASVGAGAALLGAGVVEAAESVGPLVRSI